MAAQGLEQVYILPVKVPGRPRTGQEDNSDQHLMVHQRDDGPGPVDPPERRGQGEAVILPRIARELRDVDHRLGGLEEADERIAFRRREAHGRQVPGRSQRELFVLAQPHGSGRAVQNIRYGPDHPRLNPQRRVGLRQGLGKPQPLLAIVVLVMEKMLADENFEVRPNGPGGEQNRQQRHRPKEEDRLEGDTGFTAQATHEKGRHRHEDEIEPAGRERAGIKRRRARDRQPGIPIPDPPRRNTQQRRDQRKDSAPRRLQRRVGSLEQELLGGQEQIIGEDAAEADAEELEAPARVLGCPPQQILDEHQPHGHQDQVSQEPCLEPEQVGPQLDRAEAEPEDEQKAGA